MCFLIVVRLDIIEKDFTVETSRDLYREAGDTARSARHCTEARAVYGDIECSVSALEREVELLANIELGVSRATLLNLDVGRPCATILLTAAVISPTRAAFSSAVPVEVISILRFMYSKQDHAL